MTQPTDHTGSEPSRELSLERPLSVIDTETTGLNPDTARIVRISVLRLELDGRRRPRSELVNPGIPIPSGATAVHGITENDVSDRPPFKAYARALAQALEDCDLAGFAIERFHLPLLLAEFRRASVEFSMDNRAVIDVMSIYHRLEPRDFDSAYRLYTGRDTPPDRASGRRSEATLDILLGQLRSRQEVPAETHRLARWARGVPETSADEEGRFTHLDSGEIAFNFGKHAGESVARVVETDPSYVAWVASNDSFSAESRKIAAEALSDAGHERPAGFD